MTVSQLVQTATGADYVSIISDDDSGKVTVLAMSTDGYGPVMTRYYAEVVDGELVSLNIAGARPNPSEDDSEAYRSEYAMAGQR